MPYLITVALGAGLAFALLVIRRRQRAIRDLRQALREKRPLAAGGGAGREAAGDWPALCAAANALMAENAELQKIRSSQFSQLEATLGSLQEAVLLVDAGNRILLANAALQIIFPRAREIINQRLESVLHSVAFLDYVEAVRANRAQPQHELEFAEGPRSTWLEVTGALVPPLDGGPGSWALFVLHDITKQKELEGVRKEFVANVSHELRTPLSIIKGCIETLVDGHRGMPIEDCDRFLHTIQRHTERLNSLLEDLLVLSRLESSTPGLHWEPTPLGELITGVVEDLRERSQAGEHCLTVTVDPAVGVVVADPLKISQVCANLLDNALKYTPRGSRIDVEARPRGGEIEVCVRDNGPGIPEGDLPHLFERFYRVDKGRSRETGGTGLGLSIVKHIVQLHGGRVWVESTPGKGTAFYFALPQRPA
jgi:two-component system, OmpR family, phosphate regulon sensor histidine kinase PhoR